MKNAHIAQAIRQAAGQAALDAFELHAKGKAELDLEVLREIKVAGRDLGLRQTLRQRLIDHYQSPVGQAERQKAPPNNRDLPVPELVDKLLMEFPEA